MFLPSTCCLTTQSADIYYIVVFIVVTAIVVLYVVIDKSTRLQALSRTRRHCHSVQAQAELM